MQGQSMKTITIDQWKDIFLTIADSIAAHEKELNDLDNLIGDGDHGSSMHRGFEAVRANIAEASFASVGALFSQVGKVMLFEIGGAIGPLLGSFFTAAGKQAGEAAEMDLTGWTAMFAAGIARIQTFGKAQPGDKTILDALQPAYEAFQEAARQELPLELAFRNAAMSARLGADQTESMVAKFGRAKFLGSRAVGYQDPGANSIALILLAMSSALKRFESD
jgi:dihydroxyacetone kinase-like protein